MNTTKAILRISGRLQGRGEREIILGPRIAYGEVAADGRTYTLLHAPTQEDFDAIATALDSMSAAEIRSAMPTRQSVPCDRRMGLD